MNKKSRLDIKKFNSIMAFAARLGYGMVLKRAGFQFPFCWAYTPSIEHVGRAGEADLNFRQVLTLRKLRSSGLVRAHLALRVCIIGLTALLSFGVASAQDQSGTSGTAQSILNQLQNGATPQSILGQLQQGQQPQSPVPTGQQATSQTLNNGQNPTVSTSSAPLVSQPSSVETAYAERIGQPASAPPVTQFGYDMIGNGGSVTALQIGAVQDDYVLGPGDQINITLLGAQNASYVARVDRDGRVLFLNLPPIAASGRRFGDFRSDLESAIKRTYVQTQVYISIGQVRQLSVRVVGEVASPGVYAVTGLSTVLDALNLAGGVKKSGSLRNITVVRGGRSYSIDLYSMLLTHGATPDMTVSQDDRIVVTPIGSTAAVVGEVRRPGIYEMSRGQKATTVRSLLSLANGPRIRGVYRLTIQRIRPDGKREYVDVTGSEGTVIRDGEVLFVLPAVNVSTGKVSLVGAVRLPGDYGLNRMKTLQDLLPSADAFEPTPYLLLGVIERIDPKTLTKVLLPFSPLHVLEKRENISLISNDTVYVFTLDGMRALASGETLEQAATHPQSAAPTTAPPPANPLALLGSPGAPPPGTPVTPAAPPAPGAPATMTAPAAPAAAPAPGTSVGSTDLTGLSLSASDTAFFGHVLGEYRVTVGGSVRNEGVFLIAPGTTLDEVVAAAGGLDIDADLSTFEVTSTTIDNSTGQSTTSRVNYHIQPSQYSTLTLKNLDAIQFHPVYSNRDGGVVVVDGEVRYPGTYPILRGERLSSVLARAGGLTDAAYPFGAVFTRPTVGQEEDIARSREADQIESTVASYVTGGQVTADQAAYISSLTTRLRGLKSVGRIAIEADPAVLAATPEKDLVLQTGDHLSIPRRPASISIMGEVLNPNSVIFDAKLSVSDYIKRAGGTTNLADDSNTYVVYPDGSAAPANTSVWSFHGTKLAPGTTIVVPRDISLPVNVLQLVTAISGIVRDLALSAASIAVIGK